MYELTRTLIRLRGWPLGTYTHTAWHVVIIRPTSTVHERLPRPIELNVHDERPRNP